MSLRAILLLCAAMTMQVSNAADLFSGATPREFTLGDALEPNATIGGHPIWAGEGKWRIFDLSRSDSVGVVTATIPLGTARLFQLEGKNWVATMEVKSNLQSGRGYWTDEPCKRDDILFKLEMSGGQENNCVTINHNVHYQSNPTGKYIELNALLKEQGVEIPPTVLFLQFTRLGMNKQMLIYSLWINPELLGFTRETETAWGKNPWNKTMSFKDPAKKQFIDALTAWATDFGKKMDDGLKKNSEAFTDVPSWRTLKSSQAELPKTNVSLQ